MVARFDPFREVQRLVTEPASASSAMPMDLYRQGEEFVAKIDLPGVDPSSIDIDISDASLTIRAQRQVVRDKDVRWLSRERVSGTFARQLSLGRGLALDRIVATYNDGVLTLVIPVSEEAKPRKIKVTHVVDAAAPKVESSSDDGNSSIDGGATAN